MAPTDVVVDAVGWFSSGSGDSGLFTVGPPQRLVESRLPAAPFGPIAGGTAASMDFTTFAPAGSGSVLYNLTATNTVAGGYLTAHPSGTPLPNASTVNWSGAQQNRAASAISSLASHGEVGLFALTNADAIIDVSGWFAS
jgi:hypothetical protein